MTRLLVLGVGLVMAGCGPSGIGLSARSRAALDGPTNTLDDQFVATAVELPGFAGVHVRNAEHQVIVRGTEKFDFTGDVPSILFERFVYGRVMFIDGEENVEPQLEDLVLEPAEISFDELKDFQRDIADQMLLNGLPFNHVDADEAANLVTVFVLSGYELSTSTALDALGFQGVYRVLKSPQNERRSSLSDFVRPVPAGMQIALAGPGACTLGFNVTLPGNRDAFITASHCTRGGDGILGEQGIPSTTSHRWQYQPEEFLGAQRIGSEIVDPTLSTSLADCPASAIAGCRLTDAALVEYDGIPTGLVGTIARTEDRCVGPACSTDEGGTGFSSSPIIIQNWVGRVDPLDGQIVEKTGRTTGHTFGAVTGTCTMTADAFVADSLMLCNYTASLPSNHGDSGGPIYIGAGNIVWATGILWGGPVDDFESTFFTTLGDAATELGAFEFNH